MIDKRQLFVYNRVKKASSGWRMKKRYHHHHHRLVFITFFFFIIMVHSSSSSDLQELIGGVRGLKSFKEKGSNITFDCSPSGPCVPCLYNEKKDVSYRCSETGYRIPMKCVKTVDDESNKDRNLLEEMYVTYRSCIPALNQEKLSLLAFEGIMLLLLITSSFVIFRRKGTFVMPGPIRLPTNPRF